MSVMGEPMSSSAVFKKSFAFLVSLLYSVSPKQVLSTRSIPVIAACVQPLIIAEYLGHLAVPAADPALPVGDRTELLDAHRIRLLRSHLGGERAFSHPGRVGLEDHDHIVNFCRADTVVRGDLGGRSVLARDKRVGPVIERDPKPLSPFEKNGLAVFYGSVEGEGTSSRYSASSGTSFACGDIRITRSEFAGPQPEPVLPIFFERYTLPLSRAI